MLEEEAKKKWCPMSQKILGDPQEFGVARCIASVCMMWQWRTTPEDAAKQSGVSAEYQQKEDGYCGLASGNSNLVYRPAIGDKP